MKRAGLLVILLILAAVTAFAATRNINSGEAKELLAKNKKIYLLDVRTPDEFRQARIKGAILLPMNEFQLRYYEIPRDRPVLVYCAVGSRSSIAANFLSEKGYKDVYHMTDGLVGWYRSGYPLER